MKAVFRKLDENFPFVVVVILVFVLLYVDFVDREVSVEVRTTVSKQSLRPNLQVVVSDATSVYNIETSLHNGDRSNANQIVVKAGEIYRVLLPDGPNVDVTLRLIGPPYLKTNIRLNYSHNADKRETRWTIKTLQLNDRGHRFVTVGIKDPWGKDGRIVSID